MKFAATIAIAGGSGVAILANTVTVPTGVLLALVLIALTSAIVVAIRADQRRNVIPTRFDSRQRSRTAATN